MSNGSATPEACRIKRPEACRVERPEAWRVERGGAAELDRVVSLAALSLDPPWSRAMFASELAQDGARLWVARGPDGPEVLGYAAVRRIADEVEIRSLAVDPRVRRRGVATGLLETALAEEPCSGARVAHLEVRAGNAEARCLYARLGFETAGRRPRYYPDGEDGLLLSRRLVPDAEAAGART